MLPQPGDFPPLDLDFSGFLSILYFVAGRASSWGEVEPGSGHRQRISKGETGLHDVVRGFCDARVGHGFILLTQFNPTHGWIQSTSNSVRRGTDICRR